MPPTSTTRGKLVLARRTKLGLTQEDLARRCGCVVRTIARIEADESDEVSLRVIEALSRHLELPIAELVTGKRSARGA
jgi:transcriptional regulator with XRE-family HTH domain